MNLNIFFTTAQVCLKYSNHQWKKIKPPCISVLHITYVSAYYSYYKNARFATSDRDPISQSFYSKVAERTEI